MDAKDESNTLKEDERMKTDNSKIKEETKGPQLSTVNTIKYTPLNRYDFDMNIIENWCELRTKNTPKRRCHHVCFIHDNYLFVFGGIDINEGKSNDFSKIYLLSEEPLWESVNATGTTPRKILL